MIISYTGMCTETVVGMCEPLGVLMQLVRPTSPLLPQPRLSVWRFGSFHFIRDFPPTIMGKTQ